MTEHETRKRKFRSYDLMIQFGWHSRDLCRPHGDEADELELDANLSPLAIYLSFGPTPAKGSSIGEAGCRQSDGKAWWCGVKGDGKTGNPPGRPKGTQRNSDAVANLVQAMEKSEQERRNHESACTLSRHVSFITIGKKAGFLRSNSAEWPRRGWMGSPPWAYEFGCPT